jgi:protein FAM50
VTESIDDRLKKSTVGLVTLSDFLETREGLIEEQRRVAANANTNAAG